MEQDVNRLTARSLQQRKCSTRTF